MTTDNPYTDDPSDERAAMEMDEIAKTLFAPIYPVIAREILSMQSISEGTCLDLGAGTAALSIALAQITDLNLFAVDKSRHSQAIAIRNIRENKLEHRITPVESDVCTLPFEDNYADLVVSRGSLFFWEDLVKAFNEIYRVLKPGGKTYIGGGFGSAELKKTIFEQMAQKKDGFTEKVKQRRSPENIKRILTSLDQSLACRYQVTQSDVGFWIHITKETAA